MSETKTSYQKLKRMSEKRMSETKTSYQKLDRPLGIRIPHKLHEQYKSLSGFERKEITYKLTKSLQRMVKERLKE